VIFAPRRAARALAWSTLFVAALSLGACKRDIGDDCKNSLDCSQESERLCDISQPGGYCTIEGCDERTCPSASACVRFFPRLELLTKPCSAGCDSTELCLPDGKGGGVCAPRMSERRFCVHSCSDNSDCRGGYDCVQAGTNGTMQLHSDPNAVVHFCAPKSGS
jgi:hypothetical protein